MLLIIPLVIFLSRVFISCFCFYFFMKISYEVTAPKILGKTPDRVEKDTEYLVKKILDIWNSGEFDEISVTDNHGGNLSVSQVEVIERVKKVNPEVNLEAHLTCNHSKDEIADTVSRLNRAGCTNVLVISGDRLKTQEKYHREIKDSISLLDYLKDAQPGLSYDVACNFYSSGLRRLKEKVATGVVNSIKTQPLSIYEVRDGTFARLKEELSKICDSVTFGVIYIPNAAVYDKISSLPGVKPNPKIRERLARAEAAGKSYLRKEADMIFRESYEALKAAGVDINIMGVRSIKLYRRVLKPLEYLKAA